MGSLRERLARKPPGYRFTIGRILAIYGGLMVALLLASPDEQNQWASTGRFPAEEIALQLYDAVPGWLPWLRGNRVLTANGELQLYHITQDEAEAHNLADDQPRVARELSARLHDVMKRSGVSK